jgi:adenosylcobinamide-phosphate synthase
LEKGREAFMSIEASPGLIIFLLACALDLFAGEPPATIHPVVWIGQLISFLRSHASPTRWSGLMVALLVIGITAATGHLLLWTAGLTPVWGTAAQMVVSAYLLKSTFAVRCLLQTSLDIGKMIQSDLSQAKSMLPALVGRKTEDLTEEQAASAVIESLSENYVDGILSPIFYFLIFEPFGWGLEAALAFKAISTMDSMLGYKTKGLKEIGFVPAKLDDLANFVPARLSIFLMALARPARAGRIIKTALQYHRATPSPNSGWPMSAAAGALGIRLEKPGYYVLSEQGKKPETADVRRAAKFVGLTIALTLMVSTVVLLI